MIRSSFSAEVLLDGAGVIGAEPGTHQALGPLVAEWDRLAQGCRTLFTTHEWLSCWSNAFGPSEPSWIVLHDADGSLCAAALMYRVGGRLCAAANVHSGDWDVIARDERARTELWAAVARQGANRIELQAMFEQSPNTRSARAELERAGYRTLCVPGPLCPWLQLPASWEDLIASVSSGLRSQVGRRRRTLERAGELTFRTITGGPSLMDELDTFLALEASSWKGSAGTAILSDPATERLYREFARAAAARGWLRLYVLELDGRAIAADYGCAFADHGILLKTAFDESQRRLSPGLVLRAEVLRASIDEGLRGYDFLGSPETYKTRWTPQVHPRVHIYAYRGAARPAYTYRKAVRPLLKAAHRRALAVRDRVLT